MSEDVVRSAPAGTADSAQMQPRKQWDLSWMEVPTERGIRPPIGSDGLTLAAINVGSYADVPVRWPYRNDTPRGSVPLVDASPSIAAVVDEKAELWSDNAADLYEEAIRDRWVPAADLPWATLQPLPELTERAICQLCTRLSEEALLTQQVIGRWLQHLSYGYHEVKMYLATQVFDAGRHVEAFRKRALANGGGLGYESPGIYNRALHGVLRFTEHVLFLNVMRGSTTLALLEQLAPSASDDCERTLYRLCARDLARHVAFGTGHLRFHLEQQNDQAQIHFYLNRIESAYAVEVERDKPLNEALRVLAKRDGKTLAALRQQQIDRYLKALSAAGLTDRQERLDPAFVALGASA
jgi:DNA-binding transcriptional ArsR family regulator